MTPLFSLFILLSFISYKSTSLLCGVLIKNNSKHCKEMIYELITIMCAFFSFIFKNYFDNTITWCRNCHKNESYRIWIQDIQSKKSLKSFSLNYRNFIFDKYTRGKNKTKIYIKSRHKYLFCWKDGAEQLLLFYLSTFFRSHSDNKYVYLFTLLSHFLCISNSITIRFQTY